MGSELDNNYVREVFLNNQKYDVEWVDPNLIKNLTKTLKMRQTVISMTQIVSVETEVDGPKKGEVKLDGEVTLDDKTVFRNPQSGSDVDQFLRLRGVLRLIQFPKIISSLPGKHGDGRHFDIDVCDPRLDLLLGTFKKCVVICTFSHISSYSPRQIKKRRKNCWMFNQSMQGNSTDRCSKIKIAWQLPYSTVL